jgi:stage II sporulation protein GA (sporulation sigma-E factor processing peptidase)
MYLYLDLIWLLNFFIDYLLLWMTGQFRNIKVKKWRLGVASFIGSTYVLFLFFPPLQSLYTFLVKMILSFVIVLVAFGYGNVQKFMKSFLMFYFVSFITGGGMLAVHFLMQSNHQILNGMVVTQSAGYGGISWLFVLIGFPLMYWFSKSRWRQMETTKVKADILTKVYIQINDQTIECTGLIDTGNQLYEPMTRTPVMMVEASCLVGIIPPSIFNKIREQQDMSQFHLDDVNEEVDWINRIRIVPYRGVRQSMELMVALKPDQVEIKQENRRYLTKKVLIGVNHHTLSNDGQFQAIVHPALLQNQLKEEAISYAN